MGAFYPPFLSFFFKSALWAEVGLPPFVPMPMPMPVRSGLVAIPSCPYFNLLEGGGRLTIPYAHTHANVRAL